TGLIADPLPAIAAQGVRYIWSETRFLTRNGLWRWLLFLPAYELHRAVGFASGSLARRACPCLRSNAVLEGRDWTHSPLRLSRKNCRVFENRLAALLRPRSGPRTTD